MLTPLLKSAETLLNNTEKELQRALNEKDPFISIGFTLPLTYGFLGYRAERLKDLELPLKEARLLLKSQDDLLKRVGLSSLLVHEVGLALDLVQDKGQAKNGFYNGPISENRLRILGFMLLERKLSGLALLSGKAKNSQIAKRLCQHLSSRKLLLFISGEKLIKQLPDIEWGYDKGFTPLGPKPNSLVHAFGFAVSFSLLFGKVKPGDIQGLIKYRNLNLPSFYLSLGYLDEDGWLTLAEAIALGFPVIADVKLPEISPPDKLIALPFDQIPGEDDLERAEVLAERCIDEGAIKFPLPEKPTIPVEYGEEFEGERISVDKLGVELRGFELVVMRDLAQIRDGRSRVIGPEIKEAGKLGLLIEVAGHRMKRELEPILERQLIHLIGRAHGVEHKGSRDKTQILISKEAIQRGFKLEHLAHIIHTGLHAQFGSVVDKVQVTIYTDEEKIKELVSKARGIYRERDERVLGLEDEAVDKFYSCLSCQSLTPYHICIITPERPGMCGAVNWLDAQASYEINPMGQNQPIGKEICLDPVKGEWENINRYVYEHSQMRFSRFCLNSIIDDPPTVSSLSDCLTMILPEANGVIVVDRQDNTPTPLGMTFSEILNMVAGTRISGIIGHARSFLTSGKYLAAEGGIRRVVWMSEGIKEEMGERLGVFSLKIGEPGLLDKIGDGEITPTIDELIPFLQEKNHPALNMPPMI